MPLKVKKKLYLKDMPSDIKKKFSRDLKDQIGQEIVEEIVSGKSPVKYQGKFEEYSEKYSRLKGRKEPVDMLVTGELLTSIDVRQDKLGRVDVEFKDEKAAWHQFGEGNLPKRKLLPEGKKGEFNPRLTRIIWRILQMAVKAAVKKQK